MKTKILAAPLLLFFAFSFSGCEKENFNDNDIQAHDFTDNAKRGGKGKGPKDPAPPPPEPPQEVFETYYMLSSVVDPDPLYRFSISESGQFMMLETDPSVTSWGTDYWGYWDESFPYVNNVVDYTFGLSNTVYTFTPVSATSFNVTKKVVVSPYPSGPPTTTYSNPGIYTLVP